MRIVFLGTAPLAAEVLKGLVAAGHEIATVFTQPDRPTGRGGKVRFSAVKETALSLGLPVAQPENLTDGEAAKVLLAATSKLAVVVAYGQLIPAAMLAVPTHGFINLHASILPKYRGAAPVPAAIMNGETETGLTVFRLNERFDAGEILAIKRLSITAKDTTESILSAMGELGSPLVCQVIEAILAENATAIPQEETAATRAPKLRKTDGEIVWSLTRQKIDCIVRAFQPWPLAYFFVNSGKRRTRIVVLKTEPTTWESTAVPGTVLAANDRDGIVVQCGDGALALLEIKPAGKRAMSSAAYMRGAKWTEGEVL